jgi:hypothetical protein
VGRTANRSRTPTGKSNVSTENVVYSAERATWAVDLALEVLTTAYSA